MPKKSTLIYHLESQPTHPQIPTRKYVRVNKRFADGYIGNHTLFRGYPYKTCPNKHRTATVKAKEMVHDHEYSLTQGQWGEIMRVYFEYLFEYLIRGYVYDIPNRWMGKLAFIKKRKQTLLNPKRSLELNQVVPYRNKWINGHCIQFNWWDKKFMFQSIWKIRFTFTKYHRKFYYKTMEDPSLIYRMSNARRVNKY